MKRILLGQKNDSNLNHNKIKVANVFEEGRLGGPQVYMCTLYKFLTNDIEPTLLIPFHDSNNLRVLCVENKIKYKLINISKITKGWLNIFRFLIFSFFEVIQLAYELVKGEYDLVYACGGSWQFKGILAAKIARKKVIWHLNDTYMPKFLLYNFSVIALLADGFIFASKKTKSYLLLCANYVPFQRPFLSS